ncbi:MULTISPECIES: hypothetical protein [unclassified Synechocystis]|uniref:hypothetical protein n=1 Tax=unclassified Synechocystis TaxID=2640012 RepID=UPI0004108CD3|nr:MULTISPECIES: hypothetical protein [unclassified Synechocystis]AIE72746.1 hypothetical protein D082_02170 [Synechocystis sp. PCC 6714]MCT0254608.1 hypothetical protein [Synechocystis sp. CS-94]
MKKFSKTFISKTFSVLILSVSGAIAWGLPGFAAIPLFNATCPGKIEVHADQGGPIFINGKKAQLIVKNPKYYEAKLAQGANSDVVISVAINEDDTVIVSYTGKRGANGICTVKED